MPTKDQEKSHHNGRGVHFNFRRCQGVNPDGSLKSFASKRIGREVGNKDKIWYSIAFVQHLCEWLNREMYWLLAQTYSRYDFDNVRYRSSMKVYKQWTSWGTIDESNMISSRVHKIHKIALSLSVKHFAHAL